MDSGYTTRRLAAAAGTLLALAALAGCGGSGHGAATAPVGSASASTLQTQFVDVIKAVSPSVVQIRSRQGLGSGVVFDTSGDIVTNAHVAANESQFTVTLASGSRRAATLVGTDPSNDLAVIHLEGAAPAPAKLAQSSNARVGDLVLAIGNPLGLQSSVSEGIVSSLDRQVSEGGGVTLSSVIQTSAAINPGNSGGALVDISGHVLGIPTLTALDPGPSGAEAPGIGFAIPSDTVRSVAGGLIAADQ